ncbi:unnamed protein product [Protopolystoma xenopodis]|uniref:Uncharacterized protein n=1 Tax=Protopolystoma xenopodis TaxID=117903 RepID=A0A3S5BRG6_9PLAT|nr:unnamed protein product [Protopolystoma xenopodis]
MASSLSLSGPTTSLDYEAGSGSDNTAEADVVCNKHAFAYLLEAEFDKAFNILLRVPCTNILEEVANQSDDFAYHIRPLFEYVWATLEDHAFDIFPELLNRELTGPEPRGRPARDDRPSRHGKSVTLSERTLRRSRVLGPETDEPRRPRVSLLQRHLAASTSRRRATKPSSRVDLEREAVGSVEEVETETETEEANVNVDVDVDVDVDVNVDVDVDVDVDVESGGYEAGVYHLGEGARPRGASTRQRVRGPLSGDTSRCPRRQQAVGRFVHLRGFWERMLTRVLGELRVDNIFCPGRRVWSRLLFLFHMTHYVPALTDRLAVHMDAWLPPLLVCLQSSYDSVQQEACCLLAYLVSSYRLLQRLHSASRNLLVANITLETLDAISRRTDNYPVFHGLLGYMLHSLPSLAIIDSLLVCIPHVADDPASLLARDWGLFVFYAVKHWPANALRMDAFYARRLIGLLEHSALRPHSRRSARLALGYLTRRLRMRSQLITSWMPKEGDLEATETLSPRQETYTRTHIQTDRQVDVRKERNRVADRERKMETDKEKEQISPLPDPTHNLASTASQEPINSPIAGGCQALLRSNWPISSVPHRENMTFRLSESAVIDIRKLETGQPAASLGLHIISFSLPVCFQPSYSVSTVRTAQFRDYSRLKIYTRFNQFCQWPCPFLSSHSLAHLTLFLARKALCLSACSTLSISTLLSAHLYCCLSYPPSSPLFQSLALEPVLMTCLSSSFSDSRLLHVSTPASSCPTLPPFVPVYTSLRLL